MSKHSEPSVKGARIDHLGIAVESISGEGENTVYEMEIGTNRPDAMNHYGVAREASAIYNIPLRPIAPKLPASNGSENFVVEIHNKLFAAGGLLAAVCRAAREPRCRPGVP